MKLSFPPQEVDVEKREDGTLILRSPIKLEEYEVNVGNKFKKTCEQVPENIWLAERDNGEWTKLSYKKALKNINSISQYIIDNGLNQKNLL